jgi:hypothetical protein
MYTVKVRESLHLAAENDVIKTWVLNHENFTIKSTKTSQMLTSEGQERPLFLR